MSLQNILLFAIILFAVARRIWLIRKAWIARDYSKLKAEWLFLGIISVVSMFMIWLTQRN